MMSKISTIGLVALLSTAPAYANCEGNDKVLFTCLTAKGKQIELCNFGQTIQYSYGRPNAKPEIVVRVPREKVHGISSSGGRSTTNAVAIPNGNTIYLVTWSTDNLSGELRGGVEVVIIKDKSIFISCKSLPSIGNTEGINFEDR